MRRKYYNASTIYYVNRNVPQNDSCAHHKQNDDVRSVHNRLDDGIWLSHQYNKINRSSQPVSLRITHAIHLCKSAMFKCFYLWLCLCDEHFAYLDAFSRVIRAMWDHWISGVAQALQTYITISLMSAVWRLLNVNSPGEALEDSRAQSVMRLDPGDVRWKGDDIAICGSAFTVPLKRLSHSMDK